MSLRTSRLWTIGSGKGGVGKSFLAASLARALARAGKSVVAVDADLAAPDLHAYLGVKPPGLTILDVMEGRATLSEALAATPEPQMRFLSCVGDELGMADLVPGALKKMADCILSLEADYVLIDAGSGTSLRVLDFFNLAHVAIVVTSPDPASMRCTYRFIRNSTYRRVQEQFGSHEDVGAALRQIRQSAGAPRPWTMADFLDLLPPAASDTAKGITAMLRAWRPLLLVNMAVSDQDQRTAEIIQLAARKFLNIDMLPSGIVHFDANARKAAQAMNLPDGNDPDGPLAQQVRQLAMRLAAGAAAPDGVEQNQSSNPTVIAPAMGLNDNLAFMGRAFHIQTEDLGASARCITTQVFCDGRVILSTKSEYSETMQQPDHNDQVVELMRTQHFNVIRQIESRKARLQSALI
jgi:flagellar biosynthesis protein FlhG